MIVEQANLWFCEGQSDKVYHAAIEDADGGYIVTFRYGRRDGHMTEGKKTDFPVDIHSAQSIFQKLVASKVKKGYEHA